MSSPCHMELVLAEEDVAVKKETDGTVAVKLSKRRAAARARQ